MEYDVTVDRDVYIGGSDLAAIMGLSTFKTRWELLCEKAGLKEIECVANRYTVYGQRLEPLIRDYINNLLQTRFVPNRIVNGDIRAHTDGYNGVCVLEIKTTSKIYATLAEYKHYLVQLLLYMKENKVEDGLLAVYSRPEDFDEEFHEERLQIFPVKLSDYKDLLDEIYSEIDRFRIDLKRLKENPLLTEHDFLPTELVQIANKVTALEKQLQEYKGIEQQYNALKQDLYYSMEKYDVKSWETPNGVKITRVKGSDGTVTSKTVFDEKTFAKENPALYEMYCKTTESKTKGRAGYCKITLPK